MLLYPATLLTGILLTRLVSNFRNTIDHQIGYLQLNTCPTDATEQLAAHDRFHHRGSGRREVFQPMHSTVA